MDKLEDEYLLEVYRQAGDNARMYATSRFSNLSSFLTYISFLTAALALLFGNKDDLAFFTPATLIVSVLGCGVSVLFWVMEYRHHHWWKFYELNVVRSIEQRMGWGQYPESADSDGARVFVGGGPKWLSATKATYGVYVISFAFFVLVLGLSLTM